MMGRHNQDQGRLFYSFDLDAVVPDDHLVREIAAILDLSWVHAELAPHYSHTGRPSIDPVLMIRMLIVGYVFAIRSERALCRAVKEYLATLDDPAYGTASAVTPKFVSPSDPAAQWTGALRSAAFFAYADNYLIDVKYGVIMDVEASRAIRQAEVGASRTMIERTEACFGIKPEWLAADTAYGSAPNLEWLVNEKAIAPHVPVIDKSKREDGTFSREDFIYDKAPLTPAPLSLTPIPSTRAAPRPRSHPHPQHCH